MLFTTVVPNLNQGTIRQKGCNPRLPARMTTGRTGMTQSGRFCRGPFLSQIPMNEVISGVLFLDKQKK